MVRYRFFFFSTKSSFPKSVGARDIFRSGWRWKASRENERERTRRDTRMIQAGEIWLADQPRRRLSAKIGRAVSTVLYCRTLSCDKQRQKKKIIICEFPSSLEEIAERDRQTHISSCSVVLNVPASYSPLLHVYKIHTDTHTYTHTHTHRLHIHAYFYVNY